MIFKYVLASLLICLCKFNSNQKPQNKLLSCVFKGEAHFQFVNLIHLKCCMLQTFLEPEVVLMMMAWHSQFSLILKVSLPMLELTETALIFSIAILFLGSNTIINYIGVYWQYHENRKLKYCRKKLINDAMND